MHAIAPASVWRVYIDEHRHAMELVVPDDQLSKAIGRLLLMIPCYGDATRS